MTERELIRDVREQLVKNCDCVPEYRLDGDGYPVRVEKNDTLCRHCLLVGMIDDGLAEIGKKPKDNIAELKRKSGELMRSGNMGAAVKLYDQAWQKERR